MNQMGNPTPSSEARIHALKEAYAALNRGDIPAFVKILDPQIEWNEFLEYPTGGTYRGLAEAQAHFSQSREGWAEGTCEPQRFIAAGDKIIVFVDVHVRLKHEAHWRDGRLADVYTFRDGKVIAVRLFLDRRQALEWAGANPSDDD